MTSFSQTVQFQMYSLYCKNRTNSETLINESTESQAFFKVYSHSTRTIGHVLQALTFPEECIPLRAANFSLEKRADLGELSCVMLLCLATVTVVRFLMYMASPCIICLHE